MALRLSFVVVLWLAAATVASAKCGFVTYEISVSAQERGSAIPLADVNLVFFRPGSASALSVEGGQGTDFVTTSASGKWEGRIRFNTYSGPGFFFVDDCDAKLEKLEVIAIPKDRPAERIQYRLKSVSTGQRLVVKLESIIVELYPK